jgi:hypothetical protein
VDAALSALFTLNNLAYVRSAFLGDPQLQKLGSSPLLYEKEIEECLRVYLKRFIVYTFHFFGFISKYY